MSDQKKEKANANKGETKSPRSSGGMAPTKTKDISKDTKNKI